MQTKTSLIIAGNDLRRRLRDRSAVIQAVVAPILLALLVSLAFSGGPALDFSLGVVDQDNSRTSQQITADLLAGENGDLTFEQIGSVAAAGDLVDDETIDAVIVIPAGFEAAVGDGAASELKVLVDPARPIGGEIGQAISEGIAGQIDGVRLATALVPDDPSVAAQAAAAMASPLPIRDEPVTSDFDVGSYFAPSMAILFLFLTLGTGARSLLTERKQGTLTRIRSAPVTDRAIVAGKTLAVFVLGLVSFFTVYAFTSIVFGSNWGQPIAVIAIIVTTTAAIAALSMLVTSLARSDGQAEGYTSALTFGLALLGGNFVTPDAAPDLMRTLALLTPNGWALQSFTDLSAGHATFADITPALVVLSAIAAVAGGIGALLTNKQVIT